ncbi:hypothetical protein T484DRAFT_1965163 [Baffinella frigidus]|nr:hypothetical protein T484DRAFT_1965163 [Cryptophyta sp. CCMP2293]
MVRPCPSESNKEFSKRFADLVTATTGYNNDMVARSGPLSIYAALCECCPAAVRVDANGSKYGVSETQFNKCLQQASFERERDRRGKALNKNDDPVGAGMYLFCMRRWRDPRDPVDLEHLSQGWKELCALFPVNTANCTLDRFLQLCNKMYDGWRPNAGRAMKRMRTPAPNTHGAKSEASTEAGSPLLPDGGIKVPPAAEGGAGGHAGGAGDGGAASGKSEKEVNVDANTMSTITALLALQQRGDVKVGKAGPGGAGGAFAQHGVRAGGPARVAQPPSRAAEKTWGLRAVAKPTSAPQAAPLPASHANPPPPPAVPAATAGAAPAGAAAAAKPGSAPPAGISVSQLPAARISFPQAPPPTSEPVVRPAALPPALPLLRPVAAPSPHAAAAPPAHGAAGPGMQPGAAAAGQQAPEPAFAQHAGVAGAGGALQQAAGIVVAAPLAVDAVAAAVEGPEAALLHEVSLMETDAGDAGGMGGMGDAGGIDVEMSRHCEAALEPAALSGSQALFHMQAVGPYAARAEA